MRGQIDQTAARSDMERRIMFADRLHRIRDLPFGALLKFLQKVVQHRRGIKAGRAEAVEQNVTLLQGQQLALPGLGDRALLGQQRPRAELEGDRADLGIVDPISPFAQVPDPAGHKDRRRVEPEFGHHAAQLANPGIRRFRPRRILAVGDAVMPAGEPGILVNDTAEPVAEFVIGALPQGPERARRRDDRIVVDPVAGADVGDDPGKRADPTRSSPGARALAIRYRYALAALDERVHIAAGNPERNERLHRMAPCSADASLWAEKTLFRAAPRKIISGLSEK